MRTNAIRLLCVFAALVLVASACGSDGATEEGESVDAPAPEGPVPMIVDYSPTLSDVPALMFLATHPEVDLLAVTLAGTGESDCEPGVRNTRALLVIAGHPEIPVACGPEAPMVGDRDWPLAFREAAGSLPGVLLPSVPVGDELDAVDLLSETLENADERVTIVTLGPLTNLGHLFESEPDLADEVRSIVTMGGAFDVAGNVEDSPDAEWNLYIDPEAVRVVLESGVPVTFVPLDATNFVPGNRRILARLTTTAATDSGEAVRQLWAASLDTERSIAAEWWYFWDELAAVIAVDASVATISERSVAMEDSGATVEREEGATAKVASAADPERFEQIFLETFAGGEIPAMELTSSEEQYLEAVHTGMVDLATALDGVFREVEEQAEQVPADELTSLVVAALFDGMDTFREALSSIDSPERLRSQHEALLEATAILIDGEDTYAEVLQTSAPPQPLGVDGFFEFFFEAVEAAELTAPFEAFDAACADLELTAYSLGATEALCLE